MLTYMYPASFMPDFTTASAMPLIMSSLTLHANLFQVFQPMGGVSARFADGECQSCAEDGKDGQERRPRIGAEEAIHFHGQRCTRTDSQIGTIDWTAPAHCTMPGYCIVEQMDIRTSVGIFMPDVCCLMAVLILLACSTCICRIPSVRAQDANAVGIFEGHSDVGTVLHAGSVDYDPAKQTIRSAAAARTCGSPPTLFSLSGRRCRAT